MAGSCSNGHRTLSDVTVRVENIFVMDIISFSVWCTEQLTIVRNWLLVVPYILQDQRVLVTAKFGTCFTNPRADSAPLAGMSTRALESHTYVGPPIFSNRCLQCLLGHERAVIPDAT